MNTRFYIITCILILIIWMCFIRRCFVKSETDGRYYWVLNSPDKQEAADMFGQINKRIHMFLKCMFDKIHTNPEMYRKGYIRGLERIEKKYMPTWLFETSPTNIFGATSFTIFDKISLCLRCKNTNKIHDDNVLIFVCFHELTHVALPNENHTDKYWKFFHDLLIDGEKCGVLQLENYSKFPHSYCGTVINYSPAFDKSII